MAARREGMNALIAALLKFVLAVFAVVVFGFTALAVLTVLH